MQALLTSILTADPNATVKLSPLLRTVRERLPDIRRDQLLITLVESGYSLICSGSETLVIGFRILAK